MKEFQQYHHAWLQAHPGKTEKWLRKQLLAGFDVHHLDGNHDNNDPENLILIEHGDHMRLHGQPKMNRHRSNKGPLFRRKHTIDLSKPISPRDFVMLKERGIIKGDSITNWVPVDGMGPIVDR